MSVLYYLATSASCGSSKKLAKFSSNLPGSGEQSKACNERSAVLIVRAGVHSFLRMSKQMAPVTEEMFGCQIFVSNFIYSCFESNESFTFGGLNGYS